MSLLKKLGNIGKIGGALTLSAAMLGASEKAEAHQPFYYPAPVVIQHQHIGPFGGVWTHREFIYSTPVFVQPAPVIIRPSQIFVRPFVQPQIIIQQQRIFIQPAPVYVAPPIYVAPPVYINPIPIICW